MNKTKISIAESFQMNKSFVVNVNRIIWLHLMLAFNNFAKTHSHTVVWEPSGCQWWGSHA